jgi:transcriptional regulator with XRE-family HTH domain
MDVGERLKQLRELKGLSQGEIEERTGLLRSYISRAENGHTVPHVETLEKFARALEMPLYQLLYEGENRPNWSKHGRRKQMIRRLGERAGTSFQN